MESNSERVVMAAANVARAEIAAGMDKPGDKLREIAYSLSCAEDASEWAGEVATLRAQADLLDRRTLEADHAPEAFEALRACMMALGRGGANVLGGPNRAEWEQARSVLSAAKAEVL